MHTIGKPVRQGLTQVLDRGAAQEPFPGEGGELPHVTTGETQPAVPVGHGGDHQSPAFDQRLRNAVRRSRFRGGLGGRVVRVLPGVVWVTADGRGCRLTDGRYGAGRTEPVP
ncbi:hypothetical protein CK936_27965 [Streptomyces albireticuli]|uniref:Uncharacterized protein n=1 Tax=Streptomyces albireticuli TaxID=1940 RepID=A0A2A2D2T7_9ACTN|nr:hypothetical protein CK936_27965 [Streptomyces albireticuli]